MDMFFCALGILPKFGIEVSKTTGAFWGQCMERGMEQAIAEGCDYVLTLDYDSVFTERHLEQLLALAVHYNLDAVAPIQIGRRSEMPLFRLRDGSGEWMREVSRDTFSSDLVRAGSAHFGLTLIKASKLASLPKPWFIGQPDECGRWGEGRIDDDVNFWRGWEAAGNTLHIASRVAIGTIGRPAFCHWLRYSDASAPVGSDFGRRGERAGCFRTCSISSSNAFSVFS
jgi:hypothetical protein